MSNETLDGSRTGTRCVPSAYDRYQVYRKNIEHEDHLVYHRLSWLLIAESFLLGACVTAGRAPAVVRWIGILSSALIYVSILAALSCTRQLGREAPVVDGCPPILGRRAVHAGGMIAPFTLPPMFILGWLLL